MGIRHLAAVLYDVRGLDPTAKLILLAIADHINDSTGYAWPSMQRLAEVAGIDRRNVVRWILKLESDGHIIVDRTHPGRANGYRLTCDARVTPTSDARVTGGVTPAHQTSDARVTRTVKNPKGTSAPRTQQAAAATPTPPPLALVLAQQDTYR